MKVEIEEWHAVSTWTWNAEDDSCGICRCARAGRADPAPLLADMRRRVSADLPRLADVRLRARASASHTASRWFAGLSVDADAQVGVRWVLPGL